MDPFTLEVIGAVVRWALTGLGMYLVQHHILSETQSTALVERAGSHLLLAVPMLVPLVWSLWAKVRARVKLNTAMAMGPTNEVQLKARISNGAGAGVSAVVLCLAAVVAGGALVASCAPKTWRLETKQAFNKDTLVKSLGALQHTAIALAETTPPTIPLREAGLVVDAVQTVLDGADDAGTGIVGTAASIIRSLTRGNQAAGIPPKLSPQAIAALEPFIQPVLDELKKWGEQ